MSLRPVLQALVDAEAGRRRQRIPLEEVGPLARREALHRVCMGIIAQIVHAFRLASSCVCVRAWACLQIA